jgi:hypothetical protein
VYSRSKEIINLIGGSEMIKETIQFLLANDFKIKEYSDQGLTFYTKEFKDPESIEKIMTHHYSFDPDEEIVTDGVGYLMEIQLNGETPQWTFTGTGEMFDVLDNEKSFIEHVTKIENLLQS